MAEKPTYEELKKRIQELEKNEAGHKRTEKSLRESEAQLKKMIEKLHLPMVITDQNQDISFFNNKFT